ncbi:tumor necrosis factor receptor superfamily member 13B isoform X2 [Trematomus bernacchii]|uniref:tumor necrosis factor receptor superfamily member 13B isoform X2 n=1 Tax=Trematomus bernacchii TaxID=40690 RepID=UPI00146CCB3A|nr:tumor necrosis factor receptor superfamily member 13B isoform X2 [Trematomus bernacchii]
MDCLEDQFPDFLLNECIGCRTTCKQRQVIPRCTSYCEHANCTSLPGHYYDLLLKKCLRCADVCGNHPAECSLHCHTTTTRKLLVEVPSPSEDTKGLSVDSTILLYSLLALCIMLLLSSLSLALAVLVRGGKAKTSNQKPKEAKQKQGREVQTWEEVIQPGRSSKDDTTYDSCPTETCVCVHCFPDLKTFGNQRSSFSVPQQQRAQTLKPGPVWINQNQNLSGVQQQQEAAVGWG